MLQRITADTEMKGTFDLMTELRARLVKEESFVMVRANKKAEVHSCSP
jgi:hypothetical protein